MSRTATRRRVVELEGLGKVKVMKRDGVMVSNLVFSRAIDVPAFLIKR